MTVSRRDLLAGTGATIALATLPGCKAQVAEKGADTAADVNAQKLIDEIAEEQLADGPEGASSLGLDTDKRAALRSKLSDRSAAGQKAIADHLRARMTQLGALDLAALSPAMRVNVEVIQASFQSALDGFAFPYGDVPVGGWRNTPYVVAQNVGAFLDVPRMLDSTHKVENAADAEAYLARVSSYARQLDGETERLKSATAQGVIPADFLLDKALKQIEASHKGKATEWGLYTSLTGRTAKIAGDWGPRVEAILEKEVRPALLRQEAELKVQRAKANSDAGAWKLPQGAEYYAWALRASTTTKMTPEEVHQRGREELAELQARMDTILKAEGYTKGTVGERMTALGKEPRFNFPDNDEGRRQIMALIQDRLADIRTRLPRAFHTLVKGNVEVKRLPLAEEPGAPGAYGGAGSIDGTIPGRFWINLHTTRLHSKFSLPDLTYHEAIPGHVWQGEYTFKQPLIRSILAFNAYSEGWALYAQQLADELGVYENDPIGRLGYLQGIAFRACRLVVDTGLHEKRWTREQAIDWFAKTNGSGIDEVTSEIDRYCSWPGQACGYKIGHSEINRLRAHAQSTLGTRYDLRDFDDAVILGGNVPMTVLGGIVDRYIAAKQA